MNYNPNKILQSALNGTLTLETMNKIGTQLMNEANERTKEKHDAIKARLATLTAEQRASMTREELTNFAHGR
ncbi:hypothetical protein PP939_gp260 [Rhizobium phage RL38J1]|uniref:Uncharacterized protein n=1 Tax=Rhizobium phage RL38J1 TaxID=2663232 RepID=A0A6B9J1M6_9CAUD|nr:hypothetical protein PP939_gp260 [Rhizobium phage RL38J1]QGZ14060.1 hypothetical protein RL38J1_260 [Rhizobium phage RL38J1]